MVAGTLAQLLGVRASVGMRSLAVSALALSLVWLYALGLVGDIHLGMLACCAALVILSNGAMAAGTSGPGSERTGRWGVRGVR